MELIQVSDYLVTESKQDLSQSTNCVCSFSSLTDEPDFTVAVVCHSADGGLSVPEADSLASPSEDPASEAVDELEVGKHCSVESESPDDLAQGLKIPEVPVVLAEDAQVQTDVLPSPPPSPSLPPPPLEEAVLDAPIVAEKKDMATSTEELDSADLADVPLQTSETLSPQDPALSVPVPAAAPSVPAPTAPSVYATDLEPKPKPSNELTRDYIPKVGMTTYTIVPQKSLEKLRYFEVALTLERPATAGEETEGAGLDVLTPPFSVEGREQAVATEEKAEVLSTALGKKVPTTDAAAAATPLTEPTANGNEPLTAAPASSPAQVKVTKIPPATKPKPGSFRLAQHKKPPGYYVTSAAEKHLHKEVGSEELPLPPPPPSPPAAAAPPRTDCDGGVSSVAGDPPALRFSRQSSLPSKTPIPALSLEKLRSFATPRPFTPSSPSRFAQAVSSAVKRSQSLSHAPKSGSCSPVRAPLSPISSHPPATDQKGLLKLKVGSDTVALKTH